MALDAANFIAELSITDPPGSDPLSQGDDQIRTIKRATQQSFPNIDAAVTLTTAQMNLAAIKNEVNIFTVDSQQFTNGNLLKKSSDTQICGWQYLDSGGFSRWAQLMSTVANGEDFILQRRDAAGAVVDVPWTVDLLTGVMDFLHVPTVEGAPLWIAGEIRQFVATASPGTNWFKADGLNGTVDLQGRHLMTESAFDTVGTSHDAALGVSQAASGSTVLSVAQMPSHDHGILGSGTTGVSAGLSAANARAFMGQGSVTPAVIFTSGFGDNLVQNAGSNASHLHTVPVITIDDPGFTDAVRPLGFVVTSFQYVP